MPRQANNNTLRKLNTLTPNFPDPKGSTYLMIKTFNLLLRKTRKLLQELLLKRMYKMGIPTPHTKKTTTKAITPFKSAHKVS